MSRNIIKLCPLSPFLLGRFNRVFLQVSSPLLVSQRLKNTIDRSRIPVLKEEELEEEFIKGWGPGGSKTNKSVNCVYLKHKPTGLIVKCRESRLLSDNRKLARERMIVKLDDELNGEMSIRAQRERILELKGEKSLYKDARKRKLKESYRELIANKDRDKDVEDIKQLVDESSPISKS